MSAGHVMGEPALVNIDDGPSIILITFNLLSEGLLCGGVRFGMTQRFFICHAQLAQRLPDGFACHPKPRCALILIGIRMRATSSAKAAISILRLRGLD